MSEFLDGRERVLRCGVQRRLGGAGVVETVFFATDEPDLDLEDDVDRVAALEVLARNAKIFGAGEGGTVEHVRVEERRLAAFLPPLGLLDQRIQEVARLGRRAVVGVERDQNRVLLADDVGELGDRACAGGHVADRAGRELRAAGRHLHDPVGAGLGEPAHGRVEDA